MKNSLKKAFFGVLALSMVLTMSNGVTTFAETEEQTAAAAPADTAGDSEVTTITTNPITLKVGVSSRSMTCTYIEELVREVNETLAGGYSFGIWDNADGTPRAGSYDPEFFEMKELIGIMDETTGKEFTRGYYTPAEKKAFWKACDANEEAGITFVEEGEGDAFCRLCPKKTGSTEVTTDTYTVNGKKYTVKIPVTIVDSSESERDQAPTWEEACAIKDGIAVPDKKEDASDTKKDDSTDSDSKVIEITTDPITLKVGVSSYPLKSSDIEQLVGAKFEALKGGYTFGGVRESSYDSEFFVWKGYAIALDETAGKQLAEAYYTADELTRLGEDCAAHPEAGISFACEGDGDVGFSTSLICPKKTGTTVLHVDSYMVNGQQYAVTIPVTIVESSEEERDQKAPTWAELYKMKFGKDFGYPTGGAGTEEYIASTSTSAAKSVSFTDTNKVLPEGAKLTSTKLESGTAYDAAMAAVKAKKTSSQTAVYEFDLTDASNAAIHELGGMIAVTVPAPFTVEADHELHVYRLNETDNSLVECEVTVNADGTVTFLTNHFSTYIFTSEPKAAAQETQNANPTAPITGDNTNVYVWLYVIASLLFLGLIGVIIKEKRA